MKLFAYLLVGTCFFYFNPLLMAEVSPVVALEQAERQSRIEEYLRRHVQGGFEVHLVLEQTAKVIPNEFPVSIKTINGEYPKTGKFIPKVKDVLGETSFDVSRVRLQVQLLDPIQPEDKTRLETQLAKLAGIVPSRGDVMQLEAEILAPPAPEPAPVATVEPEAPVALAEPAPAEAAPEEVVIAPELGAVPAASPAVLPQIAPQPAPAYRQILDLAPPLGLPWALWAGVGILPLGLLLLTKKAWGKQKEATQQQAALRRIQELHKAETEAWQQGLELGSEDLDTRVDLESNFSLELDFEYGMELDPVIRESEKAVHRVEAARNAADPLNLQAAIITSEFTQSAADFGFLQSLAATHLAGLLQGESPLVRALVLNRLPLAQAQAQYQGFSEQEKLELVFEMGNLQLLTREEQQALAQELKVKAQTQANRSQAGLKLFAGQAQSPKNRARLGKMEDLLTLPHEEVAELAHQTDLHLLMTALFHAPKPVKEKLVLALDSQRRHQFLEQAPRFMVSLADSLSHQQELLDQANALQGHSAASQQREA